MFKNPNSENTVVSLDDFKEAREFADLLQKINGRRARPLELVNELMIFNQETNTRTQDIRSPQKDLSKKSKNTSAKG